MNDDIFLRTIFIIFVCGGGLLTVIVFVGFLNEIGRSVLKTIHLKLNKKRASGEISLKYPEGFRIKYIIAGSAHAIIMGTIIAVGLVFLLLVLSWLE